ncbi:MAG: hypothetical protein M3Y27_00085, partial [Acidobacteriota bacterium]|nr:hypothetical protein [Acidobacteriota bacterium]
MPTLRIPETYSPGLKKLASLDSAQIEQFKTALAAAVPKLKAAEVAKEVQAALPSVGEVDAQEIVEVLTSLSATFGTHEDLGADEFVADVLEGMRRDGKAFVEPATGWDGFGKYLADLLSTRTLRLSARA